MQLSVLTRAEVNQERHLRARVQWRGNPNDNCGVDNKIIIIAIRKASVAGMHD